MKIAIDVHGGDNAPVAPIMGALAALKEKPDFEIMLVGRCENIADYLVGVDYDKSRISVLDAREIISPDEKPTEAIKTKRDSSMMRCFSGLANGECDCMVSAGSTGALLIGATFIVKRIKGLKRPAIATLFPVADGKGVMLLDCGANVDCKSEYLLQFAIMGSVYMKAVMGIENPRVGLINNGTEQGKGNELTKAAYVLLNAESGINFAGNCEARDLMSGDFDVLVCDGFVGNAILKATEGAAGIIMSALKSELTMSFRAKMGAVIAKKAFVCLKKRFDYKEYGGAPFLGVAGGVIKAHGSSDEKAFKSAVLQAYALDKGRVVEKISREMTGISED
ncbi:MAG: phosphate acyltransferase PlsX [Clostridia bacterium]